MVSPALALASAGGERPRNVVRMGVLLLVSSGTMLVAGLLAAYLYMRTTVTPWPPKDVAIDQYFGNMMVLTMLLGVLPAEWGCHALRRGDTRQAAAGLGITIGLGVAFLNLLSYTAGRVGFDALSHPYGLVVTALVMVLAVIVASAVVALTLALLRVSGRQQGPGDGEQTRVAACWWHFSVGASIAVWYAVIVLK